MLVPSEITFSRTMLSSYSIVSHGLTIVFVTTRDFLTTKPSCFCTRATLISCGSPTLSYRMQSPPRIHNVTLFLIVRYSGTSSFQIILKNESSRLSEKGTILYSRRISLICECSKFFNRKFHEIKLFSNGPNTIPL